MQNDREMIQKNDREKKRCYGRPLCQKDRILESFFYHVSVFDDQKSKRTNYKSIKTHKVRRRSVVNYSAFSLFFHFSWKIITPPPSNHPPPLRAPLLHMLWGLLVTNISVYGLFAERVVGPDESRVIWVGRPHRNPLSFSLSIPFFSHYTCVSAKFA